MQTMTAPSEYTLPHVQFFLQRNGVRTFKDFESISERTFGDPRIRAMIDELQEWPCRAMTNHKQADHPLHKLSFLADLGFTSEDPGMALVLERILAGRSDEGPLQVIVQIHPRFGGSGEPVPGWMVCDAPVLLYAAARFSGGTEAPPIGDAISYLAGRVSDTGWHCFSSPEVGRFRGPGKKADPCPYATMLILKLLSLTPESEFHAAKQIGVQTLLDLWERRETSRPYLFASGTDFRKLKLPLVWYDILNVVDTLSRYQAARADSRFIQMWDIIRRRRTSAGFVPESIYMKYREWEFGQKKEPSELLAAVIERIEQRMIL